MSLTLMLSGHDTATCQISNIAYLLLTRPELMDLVRGRPESLTQVLDELLRYIPFRKGVGIPRVALEDVEMGGVQIRAGDFVHVSYLTANRDPERFADPDVIDPHRPPTPHMTFGWGGHRCIAAPLAMAELEAVIGRLVNRFPGLRLAVPPRSCAGTRRRSGASRTSCRWPGRGSPPPPPDRRPSPGPPVRAAAVRTGARSHRYGRQGYGRRRATDGNGARTAMATSRRLRRAGHRSGCPGSARPGHGRRRSPRPARTPRP